jgi:hypothetical protein
VTAQARRADHLRYSHPSRAGRTAAAAISAAFQQEERSMSHSVVTHVKHSEHVAHDDANGIAAITAKYVADLEAAGHQIHHHHIHAHGVIHLGSNHHIPAHD